MTMSSLMVKLVDVPSELVVMKANSFKTAVSMLYVCTSLFNLALDLLDVFINLDALVFFVRYGLLIAFDVTLKMGYLFVLFTQPVLMFSLALAHFPFERFNPAL
jgi:hypothetical protein